MEIRPYPIKELPIKSSIGNVPRKKKGVDSSDKNRDKNQTSKSCKPQKSIKVELMKSFIGYKGKELSTEEAEKLIGTTFTESKITSMHIFT